jgi:hypothetical protein
MGWETITCAKGHSHEVYKQVKDEECAIACAAMIIYRKNGTKVDLTNLRQESQDHTGGYRPSVKDSGALRGRNVAQLGVATQMANIMTGHLGSGHTGTITLDNLPDLLQNYNITANPKTGLNGTAIRNDLKNAIPQSPYVIRIRWPNGTGHAVLVDSRTPHTFSPDEFCICDPAQGVVVVTFANRDANQLANGVSDLLYSIGNVKLGYLEIL